MTDVSAGQLRRLGVALVVGGICLGGLSVVVPDVFLAGALLLAAIIVQFEQPRGAAAVSLGPALGVLGVLLLLSAVLSIGPFNALGVAALVVAGGVFDIVFAPWLAKYAADVDE